MKKSLLLLVFVIFILAGCGKSKAELSSPELTAPPVIPNDFSLEAYEQLEYIGKNLKNRDCLSDKGEHQAAADWIIQSLRQAGYSEEQLDCTPAEQQSPHYGSVTIQNIELTVEGKEPGKQIIVAAHYDGNGVGDNGSGTALLLATAMGLCGQTPPYTVKYVFFDGEEAGLLGAKLYAQQMSAEEIENTLFMVNLDSLAFGDYCCVYGGAQGENGTVTQTEAYELAMEKAKTLGFNVYGTKELDGYFARHGTGPEIEPKTVYTNPWTAENPAPKNQRAVSPATVDASDHAPFKKLGIPYVYFEATNWFAEGDGLGSYTGYFETYDSSIGHNGMFMNTPYDTLDRLEEYFPGRALEHFEIYSPLLSALIIRNA